MILGDLMNSLGSLDPSFSGILTNDDYVLAVNISGTPGADEDTYAVVQGAILGVDAQLNPVSQDRQYIRAGLSSVKTGSQRTFKATGDRYIGDDFQDFVFDHARMYGTGAAVEVEYVWFCVLNGAGEKGKVSIIVNSDGSGVAGEPAGVDIDLRKTGARPEPYTYAGAFATPVVPLTVVSVAGAAGKTQIYVNPAKDSGNSYKYQTAASVTLPYLDTAITTGWTVWDGSEEITATTGHEIAIVECVTGTSAAKKGGIAVVTAG